MNCVGTEGNSKRVGIGVGLGLPMPRRPMMTIASSSPAEARAAIAQMSNQGSCRELHRGQSVPTPAAFDLVAEGLGFTPHHSEAASRREVFGIVWVYWRLI